MSPLPTLRNIECFLAVAEDLSFRQAAEKLNMSQPPLTRQIQNLEHALNVRLFDRDTHTVALTPEGRQFNDEIRPVLDQLEQVINRLRKTSEDSGGIVSVGITTVVDPAVFPHFEEVFRAAGIRPALRVDRMITRRLLERIEAERLDLALIGLPSLVPETITVEPLYREPLVVALPANHHALSKSRLDFEDIADNVLFCFPRPQNAVFYDECDRIFGAFGYAPKRRPEPEDLHVLLSLIALGQGVALMPKSLESVVRSGVVHHRLAPEIEELLHVTVGLARRATETSPLVLATAKAIADALRHRKAG